MGAKDDVRRPVVAGRFYPGDKRSLQREIDRCYLSQLGPGGAPQVVPTPTDRLVGLVSPHAGYLFSGPTAARGYRFMAEDGTPDTVVVLGPCHQYAGRARAVTQAAGWWETPLGLTEVDGEVAKAIAAGWPDLTVRADYLSAEHSLEVQLPFLQSLYGDRVRIVPVMMVDQGEEAARAVGQAVGGALQGRSAVIVASTDLSHYVSPREAKDLDDQLIAKIVALDPDGLVRLAQRPRMSMCGYGAVAAMLHAALMLQGTRAEVLGYSNSGMVQPMPEVVGYASVAVTR